MFFRFPKLCTICAIFFAGLLVPLASAQQALAKPSSLTVCADPNDLPFSNNKQQGFENEIAKLVTADLGLRLRYKWQRMDQGFVREVVNKSACDVVMGVPSRYPQLLTTAPYYRSTYVFIYRKSAPSKPLSLDEAALRVMKIGVQAVGEEYTPPGDALARRGLQATIVPFRTAGGDEGEILDAVAREKIDTAIVWGPPAGYFARLRSGDLQIFAVSPEVDAGGMPLTFAMSAGVRKGNTRLREQLDSVLQRRRAAIRAILTKYGIPQLPLRGELRAAE